MSSWITKRGNELGLKMEDARADLKIEVKDSDVKGALQRNAKECAFAVACKRTKKAKAAYFFRSTAWLEHDGKLVRYLLPSSVQKEIVSFDRAGIMSAGVYKSSAPRKSQTFKEKAKRSAKSPNRHKPSNGKIKRKLIHRTQFIRTLDEPIARDYR